MPVDGVYLILFDLFLSITSCFTIGAADDDTILFPDAFQAIKDKTIIKDIKPEEISLKVHKSNVGDISKEKCHQIYANRPPTLTSKLLGGGGTDAEALEYPHMAVLGYGNETQVAWSCGGTLISDRFVLTAAHCINTRSRVAPLKYIRLGVLNLEVDNGDTQNFTVSRVIVHPDHKAPAVYNDIALIELDRAVEKTDVVEQACLHTEWNITNNRVWTALGWGETHYGGPPAAHLQVMVVKETEYSECRKGYNITSPRRLPKGIDRKTHICAGNKVADTCRNVFGILSSSYFRRKFKMDLKSA